jgi:UDP-N-acetylglucosamine 2-epimerase
MTGGPIHVVLGTKAQYIKTAPVLRRMAERDIAYRLVDTGQHGALNPLLRKELGLRDADLLLGPDYDVATIPGAAAWAAKLALRLGSAERLRRVVFPGGGSLCIVHGDTPSTLLGALLARRAGLDVVQLEAGLTSGSLTDPFPEEAIRRIVTRLSRVRIASHEGAANMRKQRSSSQMIEIDGNTTIDAVAYALRDGVAEPGETVLITLHRVENLTRPARVKAAVDLACRLAADGPVRFLLHPPTRRTIESRGLLAELDAAGVDTPSLMGHGAFIRELSSARAVITDGGSVQEECALLGVPTLLWRARTERSDGLDGNIVLSRFDDEIIDKFLADPEAYRRELRLPATSPADEVVTSLVALQRRG